MGDSEPRQARGSAGTSEFERMVYLTTRVAGLSGSNRVGCLLPAFILMLGIVAFVAIRYSYSPERELLMAHRLWDSNVTVQQQQAIAKYRDLLRKVDPLDPARRWLKDDRDTLYRRIVLYEYKYEANETKAAEWIKDAWDEGIRDLRFDEPELKEFWDRTVDPLKRKNLRNYPPQE